MRQFYEAYLAADGPLRRLGEWLKAFEDGTELEDLLEDDCPKAWVGPVRIRRKAYKDD